MHSLHFKSLGSVKIVSNFKFLIKKNKNNNTFIYQEHVKLLKSDSKDIYNVTKDFYLNKCCSFELSIHL